MSGVGVVLGPPGVPIAGVSIDSGVRVCITVDVSRVTVLVAVLVGVLVTV